MLLRTCRRAARPFVAKAFQPMHRRQLHPQPSCQPAKRPRPRPQMVNPVLDSKGLAVCVVKDVEGEWDTKTRASVCVITLFCYNPVIPQCGRSCIRAI